MGVHVLSTVPPLTRMSMMDVDEDEGKADKDEQGGDPVDDEHHDHVHPGATQR